MKCKKCGRESEASDNFCKINKEPESEVREDGRNSKTGRSDYKRKQIHQSRKRPSGSEF